jgi:uncharacterized protein YecE (DUF72 family)
MSAFSSLEITIPKNIHFGTSSWTYPGWKGLLYQQQYRSESAFTRDCLAEYAKSPLFSTAGIDSTFYRPPAVSTLQRYQSQVPNEFRFVIKVWEELTIVRFPDHPSAGGKASQLNNRFLDYSLFTEFLAPFRQANFYPNVGVFLFQFPTLSETDLPTFLEALERFFSECTANNETAALPFAVEIRTPALLTPSYFALLNRFSVTHCFNHWTGMPRLADQMKHAAMAGGLSAPMLLARILTPLGLSYAAAVKRHSPYGEIKTLLPEMRDDVLRFAKRALEREVPAYIIVNNRAEGCAPKTIDAIRSRLAEELDSR